MRIVIALGGNALLRRGESMSVENQRGNIRVAAKQIAKIATDNELVIVHGNGPQVGLLSLQAAAYTSVSPYPLDVLGAETEGMIGYLIEQELGNFLPADTPLATLLTQVEVDINDPAFTNPEKFIGPLYTEAQASTLRKEKGWIIAADGDYFRRVVPSPQPKRILEIRPINWLLEKGNIVICAGGGGIPIRVNSEGIRQGVEAVIDKDLCAAMLAEQLKSDLLIIATDVEGVFLDWKTSQQKFISRVPPQEMLQFHFAAGSMAPKVQAACTFATNTGKRATIGALHNIEAMMRSESGTQISILHSGISYQE